MCCVLTNNLNLKGPIWYMCMTTQRWFMPHHLCFKTIDIFSWTLWEKRYSTVFIFLWSDSLYTILKLIPYRKTFPTIYNMPGVVSIYFLDKIPEIVWRGWLNLNVICNSHIYLVLSNDSHSPHQGSLLPLKELGVKSSTFCPIVAVLNYLHRSVNSWWFICSYESIEL